MKKSALVFVFVLMAAFGYSQATPSASVRVADTTTILGINISVGTTVYVVSRDQYFICKAATASTEKVSAHLYANFTRVNHDAATVTTGSGLGISGQNVTMATANTTTQGTVTAADWNTFNNKVTSITAGVGIGVAGTATVPIVKVDTAAASILSRQRAANTYLPKALADGKIFVGNATGAATAVTISGDATMTNAGAVTVSKSTGAFTVGTALTIKGTVDDNAPDSILTVAGGVVKKSAATLFATAASVKTSKVEDFEQAADSIAANRCYFQLAQTPAAGTVSVQLNGMNLKPATQYAIIGNKLRLGLAVYKYDQVSINYTY